MAHEIDINTDASGRSVASFVSARVPAWHRLGEVFARPMTVVEAMDAAHLANWNVRKIDLTGSDMSEDGVTSVEFPEWKGVVRTNPVTGATERLGIVGQGYHHVQNEEHGEFLEALLDMSGAQFIETAGALRGGRQVFYCAKLPEQMLIGGVDAHDLYVTAMNGHDGSRALSAIASPIRVVCANTQAAAIASARQRWSTRHTKKATRAVEEARKALDVTFRFNQAFQAEAERMLDSALAVDEFEKIVAGIFEPVKDSDTIRTQQNKKERSRVLVDLFTKSDTQKNIAGTRWAGYNAVTEYVDHIAAASGKGESAKMTARSLTAVDGPGATLKADAFAAFRPRLSRV